MRIKLSSVVRSSMKEEKICSLTIKNGEKLNLLVVGSEFLSSPVYVVRCDRIELFKSDDKLDAIKYFRRVTYDKISGLHELFII